jgi:hypothetical protein
VLHALLSLPLRLELAASAGVSASSPLPGTSPLFAAGAGAGARGSAAAAALADDDDDDFGPLTQQPAGERSAGSAGAGPSPASQLCGRLVRCLLAACDGAGDCGKGHAAGAGAAAAAPGRSVRASLKFGQLVVTLLQRYAGKHATHVRGDLTRLVERLESFMQKAARAALAAIEA